MGLHEQSANAFLGLIVIVIGAIVLGMTGAVLFGIGVILIITWDAFRWWLVAALLAGLAIAYVLAEIGAWFAETKGPTKEALDWYSYQQDEQDIETMEWS